MNLLLCVLILSYLAPQQLTDRSDKPCIVTRVVKEGVYSDCHGWQPAKGEKFSMPAEVSKKLRAGDTYYFVWKGDHWLAQSSDPVKVKCVLVNLSPLRLACDDKENSEFEFPDAEWPEVWHSQHLTGIYNAEFRDGQMFAVETPADPGRSERIRANTLKEQRRWRRPALQQPIEP